MGSISKALFMKPAIHQLLQKQSNWQKQRKALSWAEKLRQSVVLRRAAALMRAC
jgi:hypothetical protein